MPRVRQLTGSLIVLGSLTAGCGSGDGLARQAVWGTVQLDGQPVKAGTIQFTPADPSMKDPVSGGAPILDGEYSIDQEIGLVPGKYNVSISSAGAPPAGGDAPGSGAQLPKEAIPSKYNTASTLTAEIKPGQSEAINFPLEK
jgi:hypothetical protein